MPISEDKLERAFVGLNAVGWLFWGLFTILAGFYAFILDKPGFGLTSDYIICFFWGIGLPTAADRLSPSGVMQTLHAGTPKVA